MRQQWNLLHQLTLPFINDFSIVCRSILLTAAVVQLLSCVWLFATPWTVALQASLSFTISQSLLKLISTESLMQSNHFILCYPLFLLEWGSFPVIQVFASDGQSIGASASATVLQMNIQDWFPLNWQVWPPCYPRDSQESSPTPQFKSINSSAFSFTYSPTVTWLLEKP